MKTATAEKPANSTLARSIMRLSPGPVFAVTDAGQLVVKAGSAIVTEGESIRFDVDTEIVLPGELRPDADFLIGWADDGAFYAQPAASEDLADEGIWGGFHYAPGGNAQARAGGDDVPAINPCSIWDIGFRPACADPRGMAYVAAVPGSENVKPFWADIYLLNVDHLAAGTSVAGAQIADGSRHKPKTAAGEPVSKLDFATAAAIMMGHGKGLMSTAEFAAAAYGVTERTAIGSKPTIAGLDAPRTSRCGLMQATGNLSVWGHDGDPDGPRASIFGGYWDDGGWAGSRLAVVEGWPGASNEWVGARGRSDHLSA